MRAMGTRLLGLSRMFTGVFSMRRCLPSSGLRKFRWSEAAAIVVEGAQAAAVEPGAQGVQGFEFY